MGSVQEDNGVKAECVVIDAGDKILESKNIAVSPDCQGKGYGKALINFIIRKYKGKYSVLQAGTGESPMTIPLTLPFQELFDKSLSRYLVQCLGQKAILPASSCCTAMSVE